jgi:hypothetical protein
VNNWCVIWDVLDAKITFFVTKVLTVKVLYMKNSKYYEKSPNTYEVNENIHQTA